MNRLRVAVIGVGHLGQHHARILAAMPDVELVGVADIDAARAGTIAAKYGTAAFSRGGDLIGRVDAVCVATPTVSHVEVALPFLAQGTAVLVEKPLASGLAEADRIVALATRRRLDLQSTLNPRGRPKKSPKK